MKEALIALTGTIAGFLLAWIKEIIENRPRLKMELKHGTLDYFAQEDGYLGEVLEKKALPEAATKFVLKVMFDIFNIGKVGTGVTDILIGIEGNHEKIYFQPEIILPYENKKMDNISFNLEPNKVCTLETTLVLENTSENSYIFKDINLEPGYRNSLKIEVMVYSIKNKKTGLSVEPISIYAA